MKKKSLLIGSALVMLTVGCAYAGTFDSNVRADLADKRVDLDDRYQVIMTPTSQYSEQIIVYNRVNNKVYKATLVELEK